MTHDNFIIAIKQGFAALGVLCTMVSVSLLEIVEQWLRLTSLVVGITVGILTAISIVKKLKK